MFKQNNKKKTKQKGKKKKWRGDKKSWPPVILFISCLLRASKIAQEELQKQRWWNCTWVFIPPPCPTALKRTRHMGLPRKHMGSFQHRRAVDQQKTTSAHLYSSFQAKSSLGLDPPQMWSTWPFLCSCFYLLEMVCIGLWLYLHLSTSPQRHHFPCHDHTHASFPGARWHRDSSPHHETQVLFSSVSYYLHPTAISWWVGLRDQSSAWH